MGDCCASNRGVRGGGGLAPLSYLRRGYINFAYALAALTNGHSCQAAFCFIITQSIGRCTLLLAVTVHL